MKTGLVFVFFLAACSTSKATPDGGTPDGGTPDGATPDGGTPDGGTPDGGTPDGGTVTVNHAPPAPWDGPSSVLDGFLASDRVILPETVKDAPSSVLDASPDLGIVDACGKWDFPYYIADIIDGFPAMGMVYRRCP